MRSHHHEQAGVNMLFIICSYMCFEDLVRFRASCKIHFSLVQKYLKQDNTKADCFYLYKRYLLARETVPAIIGTTLQYELLQHWQVEQQCELIRYCFATSDVTSFYPPLPLHRLIAHLLLADKQQTSHVVQLIKQFCHGYWQHAIDIAMVQDSNWQDNHLVMLGLRILFV